MTAPFRGSGSELTRQRLRARRYERLARDVYVLRAPRGQDEDRRARTRAALLLLPGAIACRETAAALLKLPVHDDRTIHVARPPGAPRSETAGVRVHRAVVGRDERMDLDGIGVTDGPRTFVDLATSLALEPLVALADVVLRRWGREALDRAVEDAAGRPGVCHARAAAALADPRSDSPAETRTRLRLHAAGFTALRHGVVVRDAGGGWLAEPDLADEQAKVAVQYDGAVHSGDDEQQRRKDVLRDDLSRAQDWTVVIATARDDRQPHLLIERMADAYRRSARAQAADRLHGAA